MPFNITPESVQQLLQQNAEQAAQIAALTATINELRQTIKELEEKKNRNFKTAPSRLPLTAIVKNPSASVADPAKSRAARMAMREPTSHSGNPIALSAVCHPNAASVRTMTDA